MTELANIVVENGPVPVRVITRRQQPIAIGHKTARGKILVVADDPGVRRLLEIRLSMADFPVTTVATCSEAITRATRELFHLAIVDLGASEKDGIVLLEQLLRIQPTLPVIIATARATVEAAVEATKKGAYDYLAKPFDATDLISRIERAMDAHRVDSEVERLRTLVQDRHSFNQIISVTNAMQTVLQHVAQIAVTDSTVCIYGESGTGKELIAKAVHAASQRAAGPFVAINCGAIPESLLESELFGHVRGAFTGADRTKKGFLQQAEGGTLFLDEIGELPPTLQVKFLRVLQEREFYPLGSSQLVKVDVRLVAATNQDLGKLVSQGKFREDLYYRLHVLPIILPPLRERPGDIVPLAQHFLQRWARELQKDVKGFTAEALRRLMLYEWPGNVRELANAIERAVVLTPTSLITPDLLLLGKPDIQSQHQTAPSTLREARDRFERNYLIQALGATNGNVSRAAEAAGKDRAEFYRLLRKHALEPSAFKSEKRDRTVSIQ